MDVAAWVISDVGGASGVIALYDDALWPVIEPEGLLRSFAEWTTQADSGRQDNLG